MGVGGWELGWVVVCHGSLGPFHNTIPNSNTNEGGVRDTKSIPIVIFLIRYIKSILGVGSNSYIKNSHILPTGQWYAPSAVINDALIMH